MKKITVLAATAAIVAMAGSAMAATGTLNVSAGITAACSVQGGTLNFGSLVSGSNAPATAQSTINITCTNKDAYSVALDAGIHASGGTQAFLKHETLNDLIPYSLTLPAGPYTGSGTAQAFQITGDIAGNAYTTAAAGNYTDTVTVTVTP